MNKEYITERIMTIFNTHYGFTNDFWTDEMKDTHFFGRGINLLPAELLYAYFDIKKEFAVDDLADQVIEGNFTTFNEIVTIVSERVSLVTA